MTIKIDYSSYPNARGYERRVYEDENGVLRYRGNKAIETLIDEGKIDLNQLHVSYCHGAIPFQDMVEFYRWTGISLDGFETMIANLVGDQC